MLVCGECESVPTSHVSLVPVARRDVEELECGAVGAACLQSKASHLPRDAAPAAAPAHSPLP
eukprot:2280514-Prymnesium_polylepis.1